MSHNPNPFDFVPFQKEPTLRTIDQIEKNEDIFSGYIELKIKTLTPIHISGNKNDNITKFYKLNNKAIIPGSSIRGCIRSFVEALTNGLISEVNEDYEKDFDDRHIRIKTEEHLPSKNFLYENLVESNLIDIASYLFGNVGEKQGNKEGKSIKSKIIFEDCSFESETLNSRDYWIPDIEGKAIMGGANPSASSWWYFKPYKIRKRNVYLRDKRRNKINKPPKEVAEFIGKGFRGRKFYYHQSPTRCINYYLPGNGNWNYTQRAPFYSKRIECVESNLSSNSFRIYLNKIPKSILAILILSLFPGQNIRHKIGFGKAFGYGSIEFELISAKLRKNIKGNLLPLSDESLLIREIISLEFDKEKTKKFFKNIGNENNTYIDWKAKKNLEIIAGYYSSDIIFTYPPYDSNNFKKVIPWNDFKKYIPDNYKIINEEVVIEGKQWARIAHIFFNQKKTIDFVFYQTKSNKWDEIVNRAIKD